MQSGRAPRKEACHGAAPLVEAVRIGKIRVGEVLVLRGAPQAAVDRCVGVDLLQISVVRAAANLPLGVVVVAEVVPIDVFVEVVVEAVVGHASAPTRERSGNN